MIVRKLVLSIGLLALAAGPASAIESLTGSYTGKLKCTGTDNGAPVKTTTTVTVTVSDGGAEGIAVNVPGGGGIYFGFSVADTAKPLTGHVTGATCGEIEAEPLLGGALHLDVVTKAAPSTKASMKGSIILMDDEGNDATACTLNVKRTDTTAPPPLLCVAE
jgi:hypothetical protein